MSYGVLCQCRLGDKDSFKIFKNFQLCINMCAPMSTCVRGCMSMCVQLSVETLGASSLGDGDSGGCELLNVNAGN